MFAASKYDGGCKTVREVDVELFERSAHDRSTCWLRAVARRLIRDAAHRQVRTTLENDFTRRKNARSTRTDDVFAVTLRDEQPRLEIHQEGSGDRLTAWRVRVKPTTKIRRVDERHAAGPPLSPEQNVDGSDVAILPWHGSLHTSSKGTAALLDLGLHAVNG